MSSLLDPDFAGFVRCRRPLFAAALGMSRNTVVSAYDLLLSEGYVCARGRGGTLVADFLSSPLRRERPPVAQGPDSRSAFPARSPRVQA